MVTSAGLLLYRGRADALEVLLVHPGGPYWARRDHGAWSVPKGVVEAGEDPLVAARREFAEELGHAPPDAPPVDLGEVVQKAGKVVRVFALAGDLDPATVVSNTFELEWPPRSGRRRSFPEVDRAAWFDLPEATRRLNPAQAAVLPRLVAALAPPP